jgi:protein TonB
MGERNNVVELGHPLLAIAEEARRDRRFLRAAVGVAVMFHLVLFALRLPSAKAAPPPPKPPVVVCRLGPYVPPKPEHLPVLPQPKRVRVAIPDPTPDEPEPVPEVEPVVEELPLPDAEVAFELPAPPPPVEEEEPVRVGERIREPRKIHYVEPVYPEVARRAGVQGTVILEVVVGKDGSVKDIRVLRPAPMGLTEAAVAAVRQWRYEPSTLAGQPVEVVMSVTVRFTLTR